MSVFLRVLLGNRANNILLALLTLASASCESGLVNLGRTQVTDADPTGGTTSTGGTSSTGGSNDTAGTNSAGQIAATAGRSTIAGSGGQSGIAGQTALAEPKFTAVTRVASLASIYKDDNPTLTSDLLEIYFSSKDRPGGKGNVDVWVAKRDSATADFGDPISVLAASTVGADNSPAISSDGLTIWVAFAPAIDGLGFDDIMQSTRATRNDDFGTPVLIKELSSAEDDIPRPLGNHNLTMPLGSRRGGGTLFPSFPSGQAFLTFFATRTSVIAPFGTPVLRDELFVAGYNVADAFLTDDGLTVYFVRAIDSIGDIYVASRPTVNSPFGTAIPLSTINTTVDDRDPWLSPDGTRLYFSSDRHSLEPGLLNIYEARLVTN